MACSRIIRAWSDLLEVDYNGMIERHQPLWSYVCRFICEHKIKSVLEIGGGLKPLVKEWVEDYSAIDLNPETKAIHEDFTQMDVLTMPRAELLLVCAVIEHCDGYVDFLTQVANYKAPYTIISFFNGVNRRKDRIKKVYQFFDNKYAEDLLCEQCRTLGMKSKVIVLAPKDTVLLIKDG